MASWDSYGAVCVTGNWGLLGCWIVRLLLEKGYSVRSAIRISADEAAELMACHGAEERLKLISTDLLDHNSLDKAIQGCNVVFYVAAPHDMNGLRDYPRDMIEYEVKGTLNVVEACANAESVRRLVMTSCLSTVVFPGSWKQDLPMDERCWTNLDFCREKKLWTPLSKTLAEKAAWSLAADRGLDLVVINPAMVLDPKSCKKSHAVPQALGGLQRGQMFAYAHVEDVAEAHILAMEAATARGRYICFETLVSNVNYTNSQARSSGKDILSNQKLMRLGMKFCQ